VNDPGAFTVTDDEVTCRQFVELVTDYFEGSLTPRTLGHMEEHLVMCDWCTTYAEQMKATIDALHTLTEPDSPAPAPSILETLAARRGG
jgi:predicted anti-sigma-YlaC factor YlaD